MCAACLVPLLLPCANFLVLAAFSQHVSALEEHCVLRGGSDGAEVRYPPHMHVGQAFEVDHFLIKD